LSQNQKMVQKILLSLFACIMLCSEGLAQRARFEGTGIDDFFSLQSAPQLPSLPTPPQNLTFPGAGAVQPRAILTPPTFQQPFTQPSIFQQAPIFQNTAEFAVAAEFTTTSASRSSAVPRTGRARATVSRPNGTVQSELSGAGVPTAKPMALPRHWNRLATGA